MSGKCLPSPLPDAAAGRRAFAMVDRHAHVAAHEQRKQFEELVVQHLQRKSHVELGERPQERSGALQYALPS